MSLPDRPPSLKGMTLRDWFAGQSLAVAYKAEEDAPTGANNEITYKGIAVRAYHLADALLAARDPNTRGTP